MKYIITFFLALGIWSNAYAKTDAEIIEDLTNYCGRQPIDCATAILNYAYYSLALKNELLEVYYQLEIKKNKIRQLKREIKKLKQLS